jgi:nucleoside-diphosphate-sugar epimerase
MKAAVNANNTYPADFIYDNLMVQSNVIQAVGYDGQVTFNTTKPDGAPRKWMDSRRINALGWNARFDLQTSLTLAYQDKDFVSQIGR